MQCSAVRCDEVKYPLDRGVSLSCLIREKKYVDASVAEYNTNASIGEKLQKK